uniref:C2H2-type domain-containing protein n=1 Tax=Anopheles minimus TaxID=112268 RepID=A0A182VU32_9DIPT
MSSHIMLQHSRVHQDQRSVKEFSCQHEGCHYLARSAADARRHLLSHSSERNFACGDVGCEYRGKSLAQLRSHYRAESVAATDGLQPPPVRSPFRHIKIGLATHTVGLGKISRFGAYQLPVLVGT